ncbi:MAG: hypothetical protein J3Q66DRAFT_443547 [Benniella sp.]|nr:MAG: hypothetical protein J3Q66DRAFT_443547 [Benniella sp.]
MLNHSRSSTAAVAVCAPPKSTVFGNIKIMDGSPRPGSTGVRGRLYDIGSLCDKRTTDKVDRAWFAFLDYAGCPLAIKLANLLGSNPQALLIYNQTLCSFPDPYIQAHPTSNPVSTATLSSATSIGQDPITRTTDAPIITPTPPSDQGAGDDRRGQDGKDDGDGGGSDHDNQGDPDKGDGEAEGAGIRNSRGSHAGNGAYASKVVRPIVQRISNGLHRRNDRDILGSNTSSRAGGDPGNAFINAGTTVAMADQVTMDYLFQMLLGPASYSAMPGFLSEDKTTRHRPGPAIASERDSHVVTDLMVSISPASVAAASSDSKFLSMSKSVFGVVVGILCAVICGMALTFIVRPCMLRRRRQPLQSQQNTTDEKGELNSQSSSNFNDVDTRDVKHRMDDDAISNVSMKHDLATALYKQRLAWTYPRLHPSTRRESDRNQLLCRSLAERICLLFLTGAYQRKSNLDSLRRSTEIRSNWASPCSRTGSSNASTPRASFWEDFTKPGTRLSLDALRPKISQPSLSESLEHNDAELNVPSIHKSNDKQGLYP